MEDKATPHIIDALERFLAGDGIQAVHFAGGSKPPPQLAYLVNFPRLSVILQGHDQMEIEKNGEPSVLRVRRDEAIFVSANCWNRPAWDARVKVLTFLFG